MKDIKNMVEIINRGAHDYYVSNHLPCDYVFYFEEKRENVRHVEISDTVNDWVEVVSFEKKGDVTTKDILKLIKEFEELFNFYYIDYDKQLKYGCDKCGDRKSWENEIVWVNTSFGVCEKCYNKMSAKEINNLQE